MALEYVWADKLIQIKIWRFHVKPLRKWCILIWGKSFVIRKKNMLKDMKWGKQPGTEAGDWVVITVWRYRNS